MSEIRNELIRPNIRELLLGDKLGEWEEFYRLEKEKILRHRNLFTVSEFIAEEFAKSEASRHFQEHSRNRGFGLSNDQRSLIPGISIYLPTKSVTIINSRSEKESEEEEFTAMGNHIRRIKIAYGLRGVAINPDSITEVDAHNAVILLYSGVFAKVHAGLEIYQEVDPNFAETDLLAIPSNALHGRFMLKPEEVIRIIGRKNILWQNPQYSWNGIKRVNC